jgi:tetratricopeptide (TPR) repeat protein
MITFLLISIVHADTVYLKNGEKVEGKIIERTDNYIKIDFAGVALPFWLDEIEKVESDGKALFTSDQKKDTAPTQADKAEAYFKRGTDYLIEGRWQEAMREFKNTLSINPNHVGAHFNLGCTYALLDEYASSTEEFEKALSLETPPYNAFCYFNIAGVDVKRAVLEKNPELIKKAKENFYQAAEALPYFNLAIDFGNACEIIEDAMHRMAALPPIQFNPREIGLPPDSALFLKEEDMRGEDESRTFIFTENTAPMMVFWHSPTVEAWIGLSYFQQKNFDQAEKFFHNSLIGIPLGRDRKFDKLIKRGILIMQIQANIMYKGYSVETKEKVRRLSEELTKLGFNFRADEAILNIASEFCSKTQ